MDFLYDYLWPSIKVCFKYALLIAVIGTIIIGELVLVLLCNEWAIFAFLFFVAIDMSIVRAYSNYEEDKERVENGFRPRNQGK